MNRTIWLVGGGTAAALAVMAVPVLILTGVGHHWSQHSQTQHQIYQHTVTGLRLDLSGGDAKIVASHDGEVSVTRRLRWTGTKPTFSERWDGSALQITTFDCAGSGNCQVDYTIALPADVALNVKTGGGDVQTQDINAKQTVETSGGDVAIRGSAAEVAVRADGGDVSVIGTTAAKLDAQTGGGHLEVSFNSAPNDVLVGTEGGDMRIVVPDGDGYAVRVESSGGAETTQVTTDPSSQRHIQAHSAGGSIEISYR